MNKSYWNILGASSFLFGTFLIIMSNLQSCYLIDGNLLAACYVRRYAFAIPAFIFAALGIVLLIIGWLELRRKKERTFLDAIDEADRDIEAFTKKLGVENYRKLDNKHQKILADYLSYKYPEVLDILKSKEYREWKRAKKKQ